MRKLIVLLALLLGTGAVFADVRFHTGIDCTGDFFTSGKGVINQFGTKMVQKTCTSTKTGQTYSCPYKFDFEDKIQSIDVLDHELVQVWDCRNKGTDCSDGESQMFSGGNKCHNLHHDLRDKASSAKIW